jgi:hypothetical protein
MFWLFSFRRRASAESGSFNWRPALRTPDGRAIAALMTFSSN